MICPTCGDDLLPNAHNCRCGWKAYGTRTDYRPYNRNDPALLAAKERAAEISKCGRGEPSRKWAYDLIQRRDDGEVIPPAVLAKALAATGGV